MRVIGAMLMVVGVAGGPPARVAAQEYAPQALSMATSRQQPFNMAYPRTPTEQPDVRACPGRARQILAGTVGALVVGTVAFKQYGQRGQIETNGDNAYSPSQNFVYVAGSIVGTVLGVEAAAGFRCGSLARSIGGAAAGSVLLIASAPGLMWPVLPVLFAPVQATGAALARGGGARSDTTSVARSQRR
jgi:hypothetical protein